MSCEFIVKYEVRQKSHVVVGKQCSLTGPTHEAVFGSRRAHAEQYLIRSEREEIPRRLQVNYQHESSAIYNYPHTRPSFGISTFRSCPVSLSSILGSTPVLLASSSSLASLALSFLDSCILPFSNASLGRGLMYG